MGKGGKIIAMLRPGACIYDTQTGRIIYRAEKNLVILDKKGRKKVISLE